MSRNGEHGSPQSNIASDAPRQSGGPQESLAAAVVARGDEAVGSHVQEWDAALRDDAILSAGCLDVRFGTGGNASAVIRTGWSVPEPGGLWTIGNRSTALLSRPEKARPHALAIQLAPFVHPGRLDAQRMILSVNGTSCAPLDIRSHAVISVELPWDVLSARDGVELTFEWPDASRPVDVGGNNDVRVLALSFRRLLLMPVKSAEPTPMLEPANVPAAAVVPPRAALPLPELMLQFESIGENCEFGLVQRRCGAEPLGLLRFASAPLDKLLPALRARFAGMGAPENVVVRLSGNEAEFMVDDHAFGFNYHAWVKAGEQTPEAIQAREVRRVPFLVRKLIDDLTSGEKIFVYHAMSPMSLETARELADAVRAYGPSTLLWVELADEAHAAGLVEWAGPGLLKGYIDRFAPGSNAHDFSVGSWISLCEVALGMQLAG